MAGGVAIADWETPGTAAFSECCLQGSQLSNNSLLAGIYGMNFEHMPELQWKWGYYAVLGIMAIAVAMVIWRFWASGWIAWGRRQVTRAISLTVDPRRLLGYAGVKAKRSR